MKTQSDELAAEEFAQGTSTGNVPSFILDIDREDGITGSSYALGRYRGFIAGCARKQSEVDELKLAVRELVGSVETFVQRLNDEDDDWKYTVTIVCAKLLLARFATVIEKCGKE